MIKKIPEQSTAEKLALSLDNGDFKALKDVQKKYNFKDEESLLRFALVTLLRAEKNTVYIDEGGEKVGLQPNSSLLAE